jgi:signal transduction histidine kinase
VIRRVPIVAKLLGVYLVPTAATLAGFGAIAHYFAHRSLEEELGRRLTSVAAAAADAVSDENLALLQPGDEATRTYRNVHKRLEALSLATGVERIYIFDAAGTSRCDSRPGVAIGHPYYALAADRAETATALSGRPASSVLFRGQDGILRKSGFAPLRDDEGRTAFVIGVDGAASLYEQLQLFRRTLTAVAILSALAVIALSFFTARLLVRPIHTLERAAEQIASGDLEHPVVAVSRDEIGVVARAMEGMRMQLRSRDERMQMMLAGIAHEVRNPLGGLALYAGLLREDLANDPEKVDHVRRIEREVEHLKGIVGDFLEFARMKRPDLVALELDEVLTDVRDLAVASAAPRSVQVVLEAPAGVTVRGDHGQLKRAFLNLAQNAVQACRDRGEVRLACRVEGDMAVVSIKDDGAGMTPEQLEKIWTPFFTTKQSGTGLGLAFVRDIVRNHEAEIEVASQLGAGTTFTLTFRRAG